jgi:DNA-binding YbaB/EbfC family protein
MAGGGFNDMWSLLKQAQQMQRKMARMQEELKERLVEGTAGGGAVTAVVNGDGELVKLTIAPELNYPDDVTMIEDTVMAAVNAGIKESARLKQEMVERVTGGIVPPGMF